MNSEQFINRLLVEGRVEDMRAKYVDTQKVSEGDFKIITRHDPSGNQKYLEWMLKELSKKSSWVVNVTAPYLVRQITKFHENISKIEKKDIYQYSGWKELEDAAKKAEETLTRGQRKRIEKQGSDKIYEDDKYLIVAPKTQEASCHYGMNTRWCVSARKNNQFKSYYDDGIFFFIINKKGGEPSYQKIAVYVPFIAEIDTTLSSWDIELYDSHDHILEDALWVDFVYTDEGKQLKMQEEMVKYFKQVQQTKENEFYNDLPPEERAMESINKLNYINKLLVEGRLEDVKKKYEAKYVYLEMELDPSGDETAFRNYFNQLVDHISNEDPSGNNKYLNWFFKNWLENMEFNVSLSSGPVDPELLLNAVKTYHRNLSRITTQSLPTSSQINDKVRKNPKDINSYDISSLSYITNHFGEIERKKEEEKRLKSEVDVVYEDEYLLVVHPKTKQASCKYGATTQWCTAATQSDNMFESYSARGGLYYHIWKISMPDNKRNFQKIARFIEFGRQYEEEGEFFIANDSEYSEDQILFQMFSGTRQPDGGTTFSKIYRPFWDSWHNAKIRVDTHYAKNGLHKEPEWIDDEDDWDDDYYEDDDYDDWDD
jgi:23S rRNA-/tRNA-specific pseudouridylate synthase